MENEGDPMSSFLSLHRLLSQSLLVSPYTIKFRVKPYFKNWVH